MMETLQKQKKQLQEILQKDATEDASFLMQRLWKRVHEDPYEMWVQIQSCVGNAKILQVFQNQRLYCGIK